MGQEFKVYIHLGIIFPNPTEYPFKLNMLIAVPVQNCKSFHIHSINKYGWVQHHNISLLVPISV